MSSCAAVCSEVCPTYPVAGPKVAAALEKVDSPEFWEWLARIDKLRRQLELCQN
ncbi:MAG: hypothetical protein IJ184_01500 [Alphaproteobacteria bacterium]|nr:hypothetical protein [Alphaproteobacteria bacterium]